MQEAQLAMIEKIREPEAIQFDFGPNDIVVVRPGDDTYGHSPDTYRVLSRMAEDFGTGFVVNYQVRATNGRHRAAENHNDILVMRQEELMLHHTYKIAQKMLDRPLEVEADYYGSVKSR